MHSLKTRFIALFGLFVLLSCSVIAVISALSISKTGELLSSQQGIPVVQKAAELVDGDAFERFLQNPSDKSGYYEMTRLDLLDVKETVNCEYLYTMAPLRGDTWQYIIDGSCDPSDTENFSPLGSLQDMSELGAEPLRAFREGVVTSSGLANQGDWGWQISTYAPIVTSKGTIVGIIGCDFNTDATISMLRSQTLKITVISLLFVACGMALVGAFTSSIFGTMNKISSAMDSISEGTADLTFRIPETGNNELTALAKSCNTVIGSLNAIMGTLQQETTVLSESGAMLYGQLAEQVSPAIASATDNVSQIARRVGEQTTRIDSVTREVEDVKNEITGLDARIVEQSAAIQQSSSAIEEISSNIQSVDRTINIITDEYRALVSESASGRRVQEMVSEQITNIARQSENLTEANAAIAAIAEQTNLLAMNAAIEAAHAGDLGKGFGVVADEIRALAETSATQSSAIKELLEGVSEAISGIVTSSAQSARSFDEVGTKIGQLDNMMREVQGGMKEQSVGVDSILQSMKQLDTTTRDITQASSHMKEVSRGMVGTMQELHALAADTQSQTDSAAAAMEQMKTASASAMNAAERNRAATDKVAGTINGFTV